ncbi:MAG: hypothetical protein ACOH10_10945 [Rhodoglobus sp.]
MIDRLAADAPPGDQEPAFVDGGAGNRPHRLLAPTVRSPGRYVIRQIGRRARALARFLGPALVIVGVAAALVGAGQVLGAVRSYPDLVTVPAYLTTSDGRNGAAVVLRVGDSGVDYSVARAGGVPEAVCQPGTTAPTRSASSR